MTHSNLILSQQIEQMLVERDLRGMKQVSEHLSSGYVMRAAQILNRSHDNVLIATGFPVAGTFETDGPIGAIALYNALKSLGKTPVLVCGDPLFSALCEDFQCQKLPLNTVCNTDEHTQFAKSVLVQYQPSAIVSIERPGITRDGRYRNMRGEDISAHCGNFDQFITLATCPTIAIGDGGNEIGMGNVEVELAKLNIHPSQTCCDELLVADISNWAAYGIIAMLSIWHKTNLLAQIKLSPLFQYLSDLGSVDGVTRKNTLTEDGLCYSEGQDIINRLESICGLNAGVFKE